MKVQVAIKDWITECEVRGYTHKTIRGYKINLTIFARYLEEELDITDMNDINMAVVKQFTTAMKRKGRKATYINGLLKTAKSFLQYIYDEYDGTEGSFNTRNKSFKWLKEEKPVIKAFTPRDIKTFLDNCRGFDFLSIRDMAIITFFVETGVRCYELCCIKPEDIYEDYVIIRGKNHKQRIVPISPHLKKAMLKYDRAKDNYFAYKTTEDYYFLSYTGKMLTNSGLEHMIHRRGKGITGVRVSPHTFRHTFAQLSLKNGVDLYSLQKMLGHESISITQVYLRSMDNADIIKLSKKNSVLANLMY